MSTLKIASNTTDHSRGLNTVLAALRLFQKSRGSVGEDIGAIATNGGYEEPLSNEEIDALCEELNVVS